MGLDTATVVTGALNVVCLGFLVLFRFYGARLQSQVDTLTKTSISREEFTEAEKQAESRREGRHEENTTRLRRMEEKLDTATRVEVRVEAILSEIRNIGEWRHRVVEPHVNAQLEMRGYVTALKERVDRLENSFASYPRNRRSSDE